MTNRSEEIDKADIWASRAVLLLSVVVVGIAGIVEDCSARGFDAWIIPILHTCAVLLVLVRIPLGTATMAVSFFFLLGNSAGSCLYVDGPEVETGILYFFTTIFALIGYLPARSIEKPGTRSED